MLWTFQLVLTSTLQYRLDEDRSDVAVRREAVEVRLVGDGDVVLGEDLADRLTRIPIEQVVGANEHNPPPVVLEEDLQEKGSELTEWSQRPRHRRVGQLVVEVWIGRHPGDERYVVDGRYLRHGSACCGVESENVAGKAQIEISHQTQTPCWLPSLTSFE